MKVLLIGFSKLKYMPYAFFYIDSLLGEDCDIELITWNRDGTKESYDDKLFKVHEFNCIQKNQVNKFLKIANFLKYRRFLLKILKDEKPDFLICLHTFPGLLIIDKLVLHYQDRFIFDYRDSTYETIKIFKFLIGKMVKFSRLTFVSSDGFKIYFPKEYDYKVFTSHNINDNLIHFQPTKRKASNDSIIIRFWGIIRNEKLNKTIINAIANDERFELHYHGLEEAVTQRLKHYATNVVKANNVCFHGEYSPDDRFEFSKHTDILHNLYDDANMLIAVSNKVYDGIYFEIPQICQTGSYMAKLITKNGIGVALDPSDEDFTDRLYQYYLNLNKDSFHNSCQLLRKQISDEYIKSKIIVKDTVLQMR